MELLLKEDALKHYNHDLYAKTGVSVLYNLIYSNENVEFKVLFDTKEEEIKRNPQNIVLRNALNYFLFNLQKKELLKEAKEKHSATINKINHAENEVAAMCSKKIKPGSTIFVHSINNLLFKALMEAQKHKTFKINVLEHSPFMFGDILKSKQKHTVNLYPDMAIKDAIEASDSCYFGGDILTKEREIIGKTGIGTATEIAIARNIPRYVCIHSLRFDVKNNIKQLDAEHKDTKYDFNKIYEKTKKEAFSSLICEYGIFSPEHIVEEIRFHNQWMFI